MSLRIFTIILITIWCCAITANAVCVVTLWRRKLTGAFPVLMAYLLINLARSLWLLWLYGAGDTSGYATIWRVTQPVMIAAYAALVVGSIFRCASHFPGIGPFAATLAAVFTLVSASVCLATSGVGINPSYIAGLMKLGRFFDLLCLFVLLLSRALFGLFEPQMRRNVRAHCAILAGFFAVGAVTAALAGFARQSFNPILVTAQLLTVANPLTAYILWCLYLTPAGEAFEPLPFKDQPLDLGEQVGIVRILGAVRRAIRGGRRARRLS